MTDDTSSSKGNGAPNEIATLLAELGPSLSSLIAERIRQLHGLRAEAARKRIQRAPGVLRLKGLRLPNREAFLYIKGQEEAPTWKGAIEAAVKGTAYGVALDSVIARGGVVPARDFSAISGCPIKSSKHILVTAAEDALKEYGLLEHVDGFLVRPGMDTADAFARASARLLAEKVLLSAIHEWVRKLGLASYDKVTLRPGVAEVWGETPQFAGFNWDLVGPSYLAPLRMQTKTDGVKPGFFVADVALVEGLDELGVQYFLKKCSAIQSQRKARPFLAMLVADRFDVEALRIGKTKGYIFTTPENLFGKQIASLLRELVKTLMQATNGIIGDPLVFTKVFESLARIEGAANNLRGPLFAMLCAHIAQIDGGKLSVGILARHAKTGETADMDILLDNSRSLLRAIECKGHAPGVVETLDDVKDWLTRQVPRIHSYLSNQSIYANTPLRVEFWTSGRIAQEALAYLHARKGETKKYAVAWKDGAEVCQEARSKRLSYVVDVLNEHFVEHPLNDILPASAVQASPPLLEHPTPIDVQEGHA